MSVKILGRMLTIWALSALSAPSIGATLRQPFSAQDLVALPRLADINVSPDGKHVAYSLRSTDITANRGRWDIWLLDLGKRNARALQLTDDAANDNKPQWSADGRFIYFLSARSGTAQVWKIPAAGGKALAVTQLPLAVNSFRLSPRADRVLVSLDVFTDCAELLCTVDRLAKAKEHIASGVVYEKTFVRHWDSWSDGRRAQLFCIELDAQGAASKTPITLTADIDGDVPAKPFGDKEEYEFSPDGASVVFSARIAALNEPWSTNFDLYLVPANGGAPRNLTAANLAADIQPAWSPDGTQIAYLATERAGYESDRRQLVLMDLKSATVHRLTQNWDRSITQFAWSRDGKSLFASADHLGQTPLWMIDAATGRASAITGEGHVEGFSVGSDRVLYAQSNLASPADLYSVGFSGGKAAQLTHLNSALGAARALGDFEQFNFAGAHDEQVYAYMVKPANFRTGQKYPVAVIIHGGPHDSLANQWSWLSNAQTFAGAGFATLFIDFHGSSGYGQAFADSVTRDWGGRPFEDIQKGVAAALKKYPWADGNRMCALGASYGGWMVNWIAGQWPDRFKCLVSHSAVLDSRSQYYATDELWFREWEFGGPEYQNPDLYQKFNPLDYVSRWQTPALIIHGQLDYRVPYTQSLSAFNALQRRGIPSELLYFPDENHWILKPANSMQWYEVVLDWMKRWTARPNFADSRRR